VRADTEQPTSNQKTMSRAPRMSISYKPGKAKKVQITEEYQTLLDGLGDFFKSSKSKLTECAKFICISLRENYDADKLVHVFSNTIQVLSAVSFTASDQSMKVVQFFNADDVSRIPRRSASPALMVVEITPEFEYEEALKTTATIPENVKRLLEKFADIHNFISTVEHSISQSKSVDPTEMFYLANELCKIQAS
jgi:hypothetical protein